MRQRERRRRVWGNWRKLVSEQGRSGQTVAAFGRERGLCAPHFFAWKKRLREAGTKPEVLDAPRGEFIAVQVALAGWGQGGRTREPGAASGSRAAGDERVEVVLKNGRSLRVGPGFDAELVRALVAVVESAA